MQLTKLSNSGDMSDEEPPLLDDEEVGGQQSEATDNQQQEVSIMDEMVAVATRAKAAKKMQQEKERSSKGFGAGLKKGFFASTTSKPKKKATVVSAPQRLEVNEKKKETSLRIVQSSESNQTSGAAERESSSSVFVFPEVQDALKGMNQLNPNEWMNERFFAKIAKHPKLLQALQNPRFTQAINELQQNPQAAMLKYQRDADVSLMLHDFMEFLGNHFEELGKEQEQQPQPQPQQAPQPQPAAALPPIVDLDEARHEAIANMKRTPAEEKQVQHILKNPELLAALSDAKLMDQLRKCQEDPRILQQLTKDPVLGPKLRLLVDAKMVTFA